MEDHLPTNHPVELGYTNMNLILRALWSNRERLRGFKRCLKKSHLQLNKKFNFAEVKSNISTIVALSRFSRARKRMCKTNVNISIALCLGYMVKRFYKVY